jgi:hypothetical protein
MGKEPKGSSAVNEPTTSTQKAGASDPSSEVVAAQTLTAEQELDAYRRMVAEVADAGDGRVIMNRTAEHAAVVISNIFRRATGSVDILTEQLFDQIYGTPEVLNAVDKFLSADPSRQIRVVAERSIKGSHPFFAAVKKCRPGFNVRLMSSELEKITPFHFCVADARNFRFEPDKRKFAAHGRFGVPEIGKELAQTFERFYAASREQ